MARFLGHRAGSCRPSFASVRRPMSIGACACQQPRHSAILLVEGPSRVLIAQPRMFGASSNSSWQSWRAQRSFGARCPHEADVRLPGRRRLPSDCMCMSLGPRQDASRSNPAMRHPGTNPLQAKSASNGYLRRCDRVELTEACAMVAPQARTRLARRPSDERFQQPAACSTWPFCVGKDVASYAGTHAMQIALPPLSSSICGPCGYQTAGNLATVATSALPQL